NCSAQASLPLRSQAHAAKKSTVPPRLCLSVSRCSSLCWFPVSLSATLLPTPYSTQPLHWLPVLLTSTVLTGSQSLRTSLLRLSVVSSVSHCAMSSKRTKSNL